MITKAKAYSYLRFSTPEQAKGDSHRRQYSLAREYALKHDLELDESLTFEDLGVSAYKGANAEVGRLADFKAAVSQGRVEAGSYLLVEGLDRLSRLVPRKALRVLEDIVESGITLVTLNDGKTYTAESLDNEPTSLLIAIITFMRANEESATKGKRVAAAWAQKREQLRAGENHSYTRHLPFWLIDKNTLDPERVKTVEKIYEEYRNGKGVIGIAKLLNAQGDPPPKGNRWMESTVKKILDTPSVSGALNSKHGAIEGVFPAALKPELVLAVRQMRATHVKGPRKYEKVHPFAGLLKCALCGASVIRVNKTGKKGSWMYLVCSNAKVGKDCPYKGWRYSDAISLLNNFYGYITMAADAASGGDKLMDAVYGVEALRKDADEAYEAYRLNMKSPRAEAEWRAAEAEWKSGKKELDQLMKVASQPGKDVMKEALHQLVEEPTNEAMRTIFSSGVADVHARTLTMVLHGGETVHMDWSQDENQPVL